MTPAPSPRLETCGWGGEPAVIGADDGGFAMECQTCGFETCLYDSESALVAAWNLAMSRPSLAPTASQGTQGKPDKGMVEAVLLGAAAKGTVFSHCENEAEMHGLVELLFETTDEASAFIDTLMQYRAALRSPRGAKEETDAES